MRAAWVAALARQWPTVFTVGAVVVFLAFCRPAAANNCADGGRPRPDEGGIGGTGLRPVAPDDDSGIGGTGISAREDTGIIGTVTGFGSICVGGLEIHYSAETPVEVDGRLATQADLAVGQVVEVVASGSGTERSAQQITVRHIVSGPVTRVDASAQTIEVMGETVQLSPVTRGEDGDREFAAVASAFPLDSFVQVSGMRRGDGVVVASRVSRVDTGGRAQVVGPVANVQSGGLVIGATTVRTESQSALAVGDEARVAGRWDGSAIVAESVQPVPPVPFDGRVGRVDIEGYVQRTTAAQLRVGPFAVELPPAAAQEALRLPPAEARLRIQAVVQDRRVIVEHIGIMDELPGLPPLPAKDVRAWSGGRPNDGRDHGGWSPDAAGPDGHDGPPSRDGHNVVPAGLSGSGAPERPDWNDRPPAGPQMPERPPQMPDHPALPRVPDRPQVPQLPDHPAVPDRPSRPDRPELPDHPPLPERPQLPARPQRPERPQLPDNRGRP